MTTELDVVEEQIRRLEEIVVGNNRISSENEPQLVDNLLTISGKLGNISSKSERISAAFKRIDEVEKYLDPLFVESESFVSNEVKFEILQSHEQSLQDACVLHDKLEKARCVLDSEVIAGIPELEGRLKKMTHQQQSQENTLSKLTKDMYTILQNYSDLVNGLSEGLAGIEAKVYKMETSK